MRDLTIDDIKINLLASYSDIAIRGNAIDSGDIEFDRQTENRLINAVNAGNIWAWCDVMINAEFKGLVSDPEHLGACSYFSEAEFKASGYYTDMVNAVLSDLNNKIKEIYLELV